MRDPKEISISKYQYELPPDRIAKYPLKNRDQSKLVKYNNQIISKHNFVELPELLPSDSLLIFNDTRVIRARMLFTKPTGATIEIFFLSPLSPSTDYQVAFNATSSSVWKTMIGNSKRWKSGSLSLTLPNNNTSIIITAERTGENREESTVKLSWDDPSVSLAEIFELAGRVPLPPYLNRPDELDDIKRYQTVYAKDNGSVAAPTAGLHFTEDIFNAIEKRGIKKEFVTLHVGAGTFKPVTAQTMKNHTMHKEFFIISYELIEKLVKHDGPIISVGTTTARTLESVAILSAKLITNGTLPEGVINISQWEGYENRDNKIPQRKALQNMLEWMQREKRTNISAETELIIAPGYRFRLIDGLVTNFHQPRSTLLLLVAALVGEDWKKIYGFALENNFRFLSYGDSCLFYR